MRFLTPRGAKRPSGYSDGVEARGRLILVAGQNGAPVEGKLVGADMASSPVADGALWGADERAELLEGEQSGVVPVGWDLDGVHGLWHDSSSR